MPNWCSVTVDIYCNDKTNAAILRRKLLSQKKKADKKGIGMFIGSDRYLFSPDIGIFGESVVFISGEVKWGFCDDEVFAFIKHLKALIDFSVMTISYEEPGFLLYGEYIYKNGELFNRYVPPDKFPEYEDESYFEQLENLMETCSRKVYLGAI